MREKVIKTTREYDIKIWCNPEPSSICIYPKNRKGEYYHDEFFDEDIFVELTKEEIKELAERAIDAKLI